MLPEAHGETNSKQSEQTVLSETWVECAARRCPDVHATGIYRSALITGSLRNSRKVPCMGIHPRRQSDILRHAGQQPRLPGGNARAPGHALAREQRPASGPTCRSSARPHVVADLSHSSRTYRDRGYQARAHGIATTLPQRTSSQRRRLVRKPGE